MHYAITIEIEAADYGEAKRAAEGIADSSEAIIVEIEEVEE